MSRAATPAPAADRDELASAGSDPARGLAVALSYDRERDRAPRVVAKGKGTIADQIRALAEAHGIPIREDPDLVQLLAAVELDSPIPIETFQAVAEILSYIYRVNGRLRSDRGRGPESNKR